MRPALAILLFSIATGAAADPEFKLIAHATSDPEGASAFTFRPADFSGDAESRRHLPIGVFDSGIGGLTVLEAVLSADNFHNDTLEPGPDGRPDFENESFIYFGDQANMPYGNYDSEGKTATLREHILKDTVFLMGRRYWPSPDSGNPSLDKSPVKAIVIACNTATAYGLEDIRGALGAWNFNVPVIGVVEAGARGVQSIWSENHDQAVAVFATVGTCASGAYPRMTQSTLGRAGYGPAAIVQQGSVALAGAIEGAPGFDDQSVEEIIRSDIGDLVRRYRDQSIAEGSAPRPIGTVILGCTHFPLVRQEIEENFAFWKTWTDEQGNHPFDQWISETRTYIDPAIWTARELFRELASGRLANRAAGAPTNTFYLSVPNPEAPGISLAEGGAFTFDYKYGRSPNQLTIEDTRIVPLEFDALPEASRNLISGKLPHVAEALLPP